MNIEEFIARLPGWLALPVNAVVCVVALQYYSNHARRSVLIIGLSAGLGVAASVLLEIGRSTPLLVRTVNILVVLDFVLWAAGFCMLLREFAVYEKKEKDSPAA